MLTSKDIAFLHQQLPDWLDEDGKVIPRERRYYPVERMSPESVERLRKFGLVGSDGKLLPFARWPERQQAIHEALWKLGDDLGRAVLNANPGLMDNH